jgi:hypothetical protein
MKFKAALPILLALLAATTTARADPSGLFGNTLQITAPDGSVKRFYLNADGTYSANINGVATSGTWKETDENLCFTQSAPSSGPPLCGPKISQSVGQQWSAQRPDGTTTQLTVIAGR